jgi:hypothetical protein
VSSPTPFARRPQVVPVLPRGEVLGSYDTYAEALAVVDRLAKAEFPVKQVAIVGSGLKTVERVTGKLTWGRAAGAGAASGGWIGLFLGLVLLLFTADPQLTSMLAAVLFGVAFGIVFGLAGYAVTRRRHDFTSTHQVLASRYDILVDPQLTARAQDLLARPAATE